MLVSIINSWWYNSKFVLFCVVFICKIFYCSSENAEICVNDGNLKFQANTKNNITIRLTGNSYLNFGRINVLHAIENLKNGKIISSNNGNVKHSARKPIDYNNGIQDYVTNGIKTIKKQLYEDPDNIKFVLENLENGTFARNRRLSIRRIRQRLINLEARIQSLSQNLKIESVRELCSSNPCQNGGTCISLLSGFMCFCPKGWEGKSCSKDVNECALYQETELGCQNDGQCINAPGSYSCICKSGWYGSHCMQKKIDCLTSLSSEICGHGVCVNTNNGIGYTCICDQGWKTNGITPECTIDIDECTAYHPPCSSSCQNLPGSFRCGPCPAGYTGNGYVCSDIDECAISNGGCSTNPFVNCINTRGSYFCEECPPSWTGDGKTCYRITSSQTCETNRNYCNALATCKDINNSIICICPSGMSGTGIGVNGCVSIKSDSCSSQPCLNGGKCSANGTSYLCTCSNGYSGINCERSSSSGHTNVCTPNPCQNGGSCMATGGSKYKCNCRLGYTGPHCNVVPSRCGGILRNSEGILKYPRESNYEHNVRCAWIIRTNESQVLNVTFNKFDLEGTENTIECRYDWLQIHDGNSPAAHLIGRFCGNTLPKGGNIISTRNELYLWFRSDNSSNGDGFELSWKSVKPICGGEIQTSTHGTISSPGSPGNYPKNRMCAWYIKAPYGSRLRLNFFTMQLENHDTCDYDYLAIYDGSVAAGNPIIKFCNTSHPPPLTSSLNDLLVVFHSDDNGTDLGFQISYHVIEGIPGCGGTFTAKSGEIRSPINRNNKYLEGIECEYLIKRPGNSRIRLDFTKFDLEKANSCQFDFVEIYDKFQNESFLVGKWCGKDSPPSYTSQSNTLLIKFVTDYSHSFGGFTLKYETVCGGKFKDNSGVLTSPKYPLNYDNDLNCVYEIEAPIGKIIVLKFLDFNLENDTKSCINDFIEILYLDGRSGNRYCHNKPPTEIISDHNFLSFIFHSDESVGGKGFKANYFLIDIECGGVLREPGLTIKPPMDSNNMYKKDIDCTWIIVAPKNRSIQLTFISFHIKESRDCIFDYIEIYNSYAVKRTTEQEQYKLGRYCGLEAPPVLTSTQNIMTIKFHSGDTNGGEGFLATYIFIDSASTCGGTLMSTTGILQSPGWPLYYYPDKQCLWKIKVPTGQQIELRVIKFMIESSSSCNYDYLEIRNGGSQNSPLIGIYCGERIPKVIRSHSNEITVKFHSDSTQEFEGFQIEWDGTRTGCGGLIKSYQGTITSPNYPQPYPHNAACEWVIDISKGSTIIIITADIDFESYYSCDFDYLEIFDNNDKLLQKFCDNVHNPVTLETQTNKALIKFFTDNSQNGRGFLLSYKTNCKILLNDLHGVIESPNFPEQYPELLDCEWKIKAPKGNKILIEFSHFELEKSSYTDQSDCSFDYVKINDFDLNGKHIINSTKYCETLPPSFNSTNNFVSIQFITDFSQSDSGFRLEYKIDGCVEVFDYVSNGKFSTPNYPKIYPNDIECEWRIRTVYGNIIELTIYDMDIESTGKDCSDDGLLIKNGDHDSQIITKLCERRNLQRNLTKITSHGHEMIVSFYSNSVGQGRGFNATFNVLQQKCGGIIEANNGYIYSSNYPRNYDSNSYCEWLIITDNNHTLNLTIEEFDIEETENCTDDYVQIYDGNTISESKLIMKACGNELPQNNTITSSENKLLVIFSSDRINEFKGFKLHYEQNCGRRINADIRGLIFYTATNNFNSKYCVWTIIATELTRRITFTTTRYDEHLEMITHNKLNDQCLNAGVTFYDSDTINAPSKMKLCSNSNQHHLPPPIISYGHILTIKLSIDIVKQFQGYYSIYDNDCGGVLNSLYGSFTTPSYPDIYPLNTECIWEIDATDGNSIELNIEFIDIEYSDNCNKDYLEIRENDLNGKILGIICGNNQTQQFVAKKRMWIKFNSDNDINGKGFYAKYNYAHHNELYGVKGIITSPLYPSTVNMFDLYTWRINVQRGNKIQMNIIHMAENIFHYNNIFNGYDSSSPQITLNTVNSMIISNTNVMYITSVRGPFMIEWYSIPKNYTNPSSLSDNSSDLCPTNRIINLQDNSVILNSPGYPYGYDNNLNCSWIIKSDSIIKHPIIEIMNIDLEDNSDCDLDYIVIKKSTDMFNWIDISQRLCKIESNTILKYDGTYLKIDFITDVYVNRSGFSTILKSKCGSDIKQSSGIIDSSKINVSDYDRIECNWNITVRPGRKIKFIVRTMNIRQINDNKCLNYLLINNGIDEESPILGRGKYCGTINTNNDENTIDIPLTNYNRAFVKWNKKFTSKDNWIIEFEEYHEECNHQIQLNGIDNTTVISTPNYPLSPKPFTECIWIITSVTGNRLYLEFLDNFDIMYDNNNCNKEYVEIRDGSTKFSKLLNRLCGTNKPNSLYTNGNIVYIKYFTDITIPKNGFKMKITTAECGGIFYEKSGLITTTDYPKSKFYQPDTICEYRIERPIGTQINLTIIDLDLYCLYDDQVNIYTIETNFLNDDDNVERKAYRTLCGKPDNLPFNITLNSNRVLIRFIVSSDFHLPRSGFKIQYTSDNEQSSCIKDINADYGTIMTPNYPNKIVNYIARCIWRIKVTKGKRVKLIIEDFDLGTLSLKKLDRNYPSKMYVYNDYELLSKITEITVNSSLSVPIYSSDNLMTVFLVITSINDGKGFKGYFTSDEQTICDNGLLNRNGLINAPHIQPNTNGNTTTIASYYCEYDPLINDNETLTINILNLIIRNTTTYYRSCEYSPPILLRTELRESIYSLCTNVTSPVVISLPLNDFKIRILQSINYQIMNFKMSYKKNNCGGIITVANELRITELDIHNNTDCAWQILPRSFTDNDDDNTIPIYITVQTNFKLNCDTEYLQIYRGVLPNRPHLNNKRFCEQILINSSTIHGLYIEYHNKNELINLNSKFTITLNYDENCGGYLTSPFPNIKLNKIYTNSQECIWYVIAPIGYIIEFEFYDRFYIELSKNCTNDYIEFYEFYNDNNNDADINEFHNVFENYQKKKLLGHYCGRIKPNNSISNERFVQIISRTNDNNIHGDGFSLNLKLKCGGIYHVKKEHNILTSPNYPKNYDSNLYCNYTFITENDEDYINLRILDLELETYNKCYYDNLTICTGHDSLIENEYNKCEVICDNELIKEIRDKGKILIIFQTDNDSGRKGFKLQYNLDECGGNITSSQIIKSPTKLFDNTYLNNMNCYWNIIAPINKKIVIKFEYFEMEFSTNCMYDFVEIYSGLHKTADGRLARLCGNLTGQLSSINIKNHYAIINSHTDSRDTFLGFSAVINFVNECDHDIDLNDVNKIFILNTYSGSYDNNLDCHYIIKTIDGYHIRATFKTFHLSECISNSISNNSKNSSSSSSIQNIENDNPKNYCDYLEFYDGEGQFADLIGKFTGHNLPFNITSTKSSLYMRFVTDSVDTSTGFEISFTTIKTVCGPTQYNVQENKPIYITSPGNDISYLPSIQCQWKIVGQYETLNFHFEKFDLEESDNKGFCSSDLLEIVTTKNPDLIQEGFGSSTIYRGKTGHESVSPILMDDDYYHHMYCGNGIPDDYYVETSNAIVRFKTNDQIQKSGFKIKVTADRSCSRNYTSTQGRINIKITENCNFTINSPENYTITLYYGSSYFSTSNCNDEYLKVTDLKSGKLLQTVCSDTDPTKSLFTNTNRLEIFIKNPGVYTNYDLTYLATNQGPGCGGDLYNYEGLFTSPMYPFNDRGYSDCKWNIRVPNNKKVLIYFDIFDMGSRVTCGSDYLEIIEKTNAGEDNVVRRYCGEDKPKIYVSEKNKLSIKFHKTLNYDGTGWVIRFTTVGSHPKWIENDY